MSPLANFFRNWREKHAHNREISTIDPSEIEAMGLSRQEFLAIARMPAEQIARMKKMMRLHGADPEKMARDLAHLEPAKTCSSCTAQGACVRELSAGATTPARTGFCPNGETFAAFAAAG